MESKSENVEDGLVSEGKQEKKSLVSGLLWEPDFISKDEENKLIEELDKNEWNTELKRRVQHYGGFVKLLNLLQVTFILIKRKSVMNH